MDLMLVDVSGIAHRAFHSTGGLTLRGQPIGTTFGVFAETKQLIQMYPTFVIVMCYDAGYAARQKAFPGYKATRRDKQRTEQEQFDRVAFLQQLDALPEVLHRAGLKNHVKVTGWEADDVIACLAKRYAAHDHRVLIVSSDADMYQLLGPRVRIIPSAARKNEVRTLAWFRGEWGIDPESWPLVKALAGCSSDNIPGIRGVGEKTAARYVRGEAIREALAVAIRSDAGAAVVGRNLSLTRLPHHEFPDTEAPNALPIFPKRDAWNEVCREFRFRSLMVANGETGFQD